MELVTNAPSGNALQTVANVGARTLVAPKSLSATATFILSEEGRKVSLLAGGDGKAVQAVALDVPASRLHLVAVDRQGVARLRLRPRFELDANQHVVRLDSSPAFDAPPAPEDLLRLAARNHELEQTYHSARTAASLTRQDAQRELRERVAQAFLADSAQRALSHPPPTQRRCCIEAEGRRIVFDVVEDPVLAKTVALEATRRFRTDQRAKRDQNLQERAKQLALHEEKKRFVADWITAHGTDEQRIRLAAGVLPMSEAVDSISRHEFAALSKFEPYVHDGLGRLQALAARSGVRTEVAVSASSLRVDTEHSTAATAAQWAVVVSIRELIPGAEATLLRHRITLSGAPGALSVTAHAVLVTLKRGPIVLRTEVSAPDA